MVADFEASGVKTCSTGVAESVKKQGQRSLAGTRGQSLHSSCSAAQEAVTESMA